jgi:hypothetical protein
MVRTCRSRISDPGRHCGMASSTPPAQYRGLGPRGARISGAQCSLVSIPSCRSGPARAAPTSNGYCRPAKSCRRSTAKRTGLSPSDHLLRVTIISGGQIFGWFAGFEHPVVNRRRESHSGSRCLRTFEEGGAVQHLTHPSIAHLRRGRLRHVLPQATRRAYRQTSSRTSGRARGDGRCRGPGGKVERRRARTIALTLAALDGIRSRPRVGAAVRSLRRMRHGRAPELTRSETRERPATR